MNEEYLDELLNSGADPNKTEDNMLDMVEQAKKAAADDNAGRSNGDVELNDEDKELLGADKLDDIPDESDASLTDSDMQRLSDMENAAKDDEPAEAHEDSISIEDLFGGADETSDSPGNSAEDSINAAANTAAPDAGQSSDSEAQGDGNDTPSVPENRGGKGLFALIKRIFFEDTKKHQEEEHEGEEPKDENEKLLQEMYGDDIEDGELLEDKNRKGKGPFAKLAENLRARRAKAAEEDRLEEEAIEAEAAEKKRKKEEKKQAAKAKKDAAKNDKADKAKKAKEKKAAKPKKEKKAKPKKEKKPKAPVDPKDILKIKPLSVVMLLMFVAGFVIMVQLFSGLFDYSNNISRAKEFMQNGNYTSAYDIVHGMSLSKADSNIQNQLDVIMLVERQYESYENYRKLGMNVDALNALIKGLVQYNTYKEQGESLGVIEPMNQYRQAILEKLLSDYKIDEKLANDLVTLFGSDFTKYYRSIETYGGAK
mgnify:FL=1